LALDLTLQRLSFLIDIAVRYCSGRWMTSERGLGLWLLGDSMMLRRLMFVGWHGDIAVFTVRVALHDFCRGNAVYTVRALARLGWLGWGASFEQRCAALT
jgi:hypothetical protein